MTAIVEFEGTTFREIGGNVYADAPYAVRIEVGRALTAAEAEQLAGLVGYAYAKTGGERGNGFTHDTPNSIIYWCDTTKGRAYKRLDDFFSDAEDYIVHGSPQRKTKNNTRLIEGLGDVGGVRFFADSVFGEDPDPSPEPALTPAPTGDPKQGIYTVDDTQYRIGKTGRTTQFRAGKWRPLTADQSQDAYNRVAARGVKTPVSDLQSLGRASGVCLACGRPLSDAKSQARGMGADCYRKYGGT